MARGHQLSSTDICALPQYINVSTRLAARVTNNEKERERDRERERQRQRQRQREKNPI